MCLPSPQQSVKLGLPLVPDAFSSINIRASQWRQGVTISLNLFLPGNIVVCLAILWFISFPAITGLPFTVGFNGHNLCVIRLWVVDPQ